MSSDCDRRFTPRFNLKVPFIFCPMNTPIECGDTVKSINISKRGLYFRTKQPLFVGLPVRVLLEMPGKCGGKLATRVVFTGRVSHVAAKRRGHATSGVGVEFFYSEAFDR